MARARYIVRSHKGWWKVYDKVNKTSNCFTSHKDKAEREALRLNAREIENRL